MEKPRQHAEHGAQLSLLQAHRAQRRQRGRIPSGVIDPLDALRASAQIAERAWRGVGVGGQAWGSEVGGWRPDLRQIPRRGHKWV